MLCPVFFTIFPQNFLLPRPQAARRPLPSAAVCGQLSTHSIGFSCYVGWLRGEAGRRRTGQSRRGETRSSDSIPPSSRASLLASARLSSALECDQLSVSRLHWLIRLSCLLGCLRSSHPSKSISRSTPLTPQYSPLRHSSPLPPSSSLRHGVSMGMAEQRAVSQSHARAHASIRAKTASGDAQSDSNVAAHVRRAATGRRGQQQRGEQHGQRIGGGGSRASQ